MSRNIAIFIAAAAAIAGLLFASFSTHDFVQHLDRDIHGLNCSFLPGIAAAAQPGESGCHVTMMSPYSSVLRETVWGGIPISMLAMGVFAFLFAFAAFLGLSGRQEDVRANGFHLLAWALPVIASAVMGYVAYSTLDAACKLCIGIYIASFVGLVAALAGFLRARAVERTPLAEGQPPRESGLGWGLLAAAFFIGVIFVAVPVVTYATTAPDFGRYVGSCGTLSDARDPHGILLPIGPQSRDVPVIEVFDPMCPACRAFERRLDVASVNEQISRRIALFPLDSTCNWMVTETLHPGACAISEAILCAEGDAKSVIDWAFENQEQIVAATRRSPGAAARMARARFPMIAQCLGTPEVQAKLNQSLRWAVQNELPVLTPQVYVGNLRLCDADTDLGMDFALTRLVDRWRRSPHPPPPPEEPAPPVIPPAPPRAVPPPAPMPTPPPVAPTPQQPVEPAPTPTQPPEPAQPPPSQAQPPAPVPAPAPEPAPEETEAP